jgi:hypothetical protein
MSKQYPGGLITKTPVTPNSISAPGIWSLSDQAEAQGTNTWPFPRDPQFNYVTMLLHGDGSAGAVAMGSGAGTSSTVTNFNADASTNNFNVTINGDARSDNFTPYQAGYYSNYFGGSGNSINYPSATQYAIGTGNFTLEFLVNFSALNAGHNRMFAIGASGTDGLEIDLNGTTLEVGIQNGYPISYTWTPTVGTWYYMAVTRSGSTVTLYINGTSVATGTSSNSISQNSLSIGGITWQSTWSINGFLSNVRLSNTVRTIATPTTPYTSDANTLFLGAQSNRFLDTSSYAATATATGTPQVSFFQPFTSPSSVATYGSGYFDGTGDYLTAASTTAFDIASGTNFTFSCWVYFASNPNNGTVKYIFDQTSTSGSGSLIFLAQEVGNSWTAGPLANAYTASDFIAGQWYWITISRNSGTLRSFKNGVQIASVASTDVSDTNRFTIGARYSDNFPISSAYLTDVRFVVGSGITTDTVPTSPLTAITNTQLLTTQYNGGGNNSGFKDSGPFNFPITRNGNATQGTFTPYSADWSNYFNGSSSLSCNVSGISAGTSTFTFEAWVFLTSMAGDSILFDTRSSNGVSTTGMDVAVYSSGNMKFYDGTETNLGGTVTANVWTHIALVRNSSNVVTAYINGTATGTTVSSTRNFSDNYFWIASVPGPVAPYLNGYMSNLRWVVGTAVYTSNFTPSTTPLTAITNTKLLTCQSNRFVDNSTNAYTITVNSTPRVQGFSPFAPLTVYNPATYGGSGYFDGNNDWLTTASSSVFAFGTGNFTLEAWVYPTASQTDNWIIGLYNNCWLRVGSTGALEFYNSVGSAAITAPSVLPLNTWSHVAAVRNGTTLTLYQNGVSVASGTVSSSYTTSVACTVGNQGSAFARYWNGYICDARVTNTAVYTAAFTPPTAPLTAITGTSLLVSTTNAGILDNSMLNNLETVGNAAVSTSVVKYGTASMYFDGVGDYLIAPPNTQGLLLGTGSFTIEFWIYPAASQPTTRTPIISFGDGFTTNVWDIQLNNTSPSYTNRIQLWAYNLNSGAVVAVSTGTISATTWTHVAVVRNGTGFTIYINGTADGTGTSSASMDGGSTTLQFQVAKNSTDYFSGYIDDLRITKYARYTATFTPPTQAFPNG